MISIIIPIYNEEEVIEQTLKNIIEVSLKFKEIVEIIVVNDGSSDNSLEKIKKFDNIVVLDQPYNIGYGAALKRGIRESIGEYILFIDSDGQHDANDIENIIKDHKKYDMIVGKRITIKGSPVNRWAGKIFLTKFASYLAEFNIEDLNSGFRIVNKEKALKFISVYPNGFSITTTMTMTFIKAGFTLKYIPINIHKRIGSSTLKPVNDGIRTLLLIFKTVVIFHPMKVFFPISIILFLGGILSLSYEFMYRSINIPDSAILLFTCSLLVFFFGLLADMISTITKGENNFSHIKERIVKK